MTVNIGGETISYTRRRSLRAGKMTLRVRESGVELVLPFAVSDSDGSRFLIDNSQWLLGQLKKLSEYKISRSNAAEDMDGCCYYRGMRTEVRVICVGTGLRARTEHKDGVIWISLPENCPVTASAALERWLKLTAEFELKSQVARLAPMLSVNPKRVAVRDQKSRWGSCSSKGNLNFNWRLIMAPPDVLTYVVVHELSHLVEHNHSPGFWNLVRSILPDYQKQRAWLKNFGWLLRLPIAPALE